MPAPTLLAIPLSLKSWMLLTVPIERLTLPPEPVPHIIETLVNPIKRPARKSDQTGRNRKAPAYDDPADLQRDMYRNAQNMGIGVLLEELPAPGGEMAITIGPRFAELFPNLAGLNNWNPRRRWPNSDERWKELREDAKDPEFFQRQYMQEPRL